jgi:hypothetical protein
LSYAHAGAKKRFDQARPVDGIERCRLQCRPARFVVWRKPSLDDARPNAMTKEFARREQSGGTRPDNQYG